MEMPFIIIIQIILMSLSLYFMFCFFVYNRAHVVIYLFGVKLASHMNKNWIEFNWIHNNQPNLVCPSVPLCFSKTTSRRNKFVKTKYIPFGEGTPGKLSIFLLHPWVRAKSFPHYFVCRKRYCGIFGPSTRTHCTDFLCTVQFACVLESMGLAKYRILQHLME
jgi:hypothetical protein